MKFVDIAIGQVIFEESPVGLGRQLRRMRGVNDVKVDSSTHRVHITYDDVQLSRDDVYRLVIGCGHTFTPVDAPDDPVQLAERA
jgi:hypothetical protein